jgi:hypothetical protein
MYYISWLVSRGLQSSLQTRGGSRKSDVLNKMFSGRLCGYRQRFWIWVVVTGVTATQRQMWTPEREQHPEVYYLEIS